MNIGIDIDDTITNTYESNISYGQNYEINNLNKESQIEDVNRYFDKLFNWSKDDFNNYLEKNAAKVLKSVSIKPFCRKIINRLKKEGCNIIIITARGKDYHKLEDSYNLCDRWLKNKCINYDKLIVGCGYKLKECQKNSIDIFIDDKFENCKNVSENGIKALMMHAYHNQFENDDNIKRVYSWPQIYYEVKKYQDRII